MAKVVVIGGGIIGLCSAYYLAKDGHKVTILDQQEKGEGASYINAGYITPSHFMPLAAPGVVAQGLKWMFNKTSPLYIKPRWDIDFFKWALYFKSFATKKHVTNSIPLLLDLNLRSQQLYEQLLVDTGLNFHYENKGVLMVCKTKKHFIHEKELAKNATDLGLNVTVHSNEDLLRLQPALAPELVGGVHYACDSHMTPQNFIRQLKEYLLQAGVTIKWQQQVIGFEKENGRLQQVLTKKAQFVADQVVLATGSYTGGLAKQLGLQIPIQGGKGYSMDVFRKTNITIPAILVESRVAITPMDGFTRFAGTMEFSGNNNTLNKARIATIAHAANTYYPEVQIHKEELKKAKSGLRPVSPDGIPIIGHTKKYKNLNIATGHAMMGWSLGPITGKLIAENISGKNNYAWAKQLSPDRFA
ncbi:NAD(P)/FAD-dependent oxidoreductase [Croceivirga radicis]|uniref:NAD(P)/FAD-dependent oxidoreductase n=1 Tax=Croceivirga radicis TaxID=1929488 RepID=UPI000255AAB2|nr:FAD-dependent oxidoreductase [Croceivirga radicis]